MRAKVLTMTSRYFCEATWHDRQPPDRPELSFYLSVTTWVARDDGDVFSGCGCLSGPRQAPFNSTLFRYGRRGRVGVST